MFDNEYVLDIWRFQWLFGMGILATKCKKLISTENKIEVSCCFKPFTLIYLGSPHYWPRSLHLLCSNFLPKANRFVYLAFLLGLSGSTAVGVGGGSHWGATSLETGCWLVSCPSPVWDTWHGIRGSLPREVSPPLFSNFTLSELPRRPGMLHITWKWFGGQGKEE